jgi:steroid delta-isomerase-like uncharacterized protein
MKPAVPRPARLSVLWTVLLSIPASAAPFSSSDSVLTALQPSTLVRMFIDEVWNDRCVERIGSYVADTCMVSAPGVGEKARGPAWVRGQLEVCLALVPDLRIEIDELLAHEDQVAIRWTMSGSSSGELKGLQGDGRRTSLSGAAHVQVCDGKIMRAWCLFDRTAIYRDLGVPCSSPREPVIRRGLEGVAPKAPVASRRAFSIGMLASLSDGPPSISWAREPKSRG